MKTKIISFDLETAKKIQSGEIKGKIKTREGIEIREFFFFSEVAVGIYPIYATIDGIVHSYCYDGYERNWDRSGHWKGDLALEVLDNKPQFKPFDKVLCRDNDDDVWKANLFSHKECELSYPYYVCGGSFYKKCIPYEGNEHLIGTTDKPKEE